MEYLSELNKEQRKAAEHIEGPAMVIAGAGSGKTRVLTYRIAHLMESGIDPFNILALTFTNKAAREMKERIGKIVSATEVKNLWMGTFHSVFARILRYEADKIGYPSNFTIYDTDDSKSLLKTITKELNLDDKIYKPNLVYNRISSAKNNLLSAKAYLQEPTIQSHDLQSGKPRIGEIYQIYERRCFRAGAMDFDDLLFKTNILLRDFPEALNKYQDKFRFILVDEFQDTNYSQYVIIRQLAARHENICVVGDDAQSIYAFRGASIQNILNFKKDYPDTQTFKLEQNYRSTKNIVLAANSLIEKNKKQLEKEVWTDNDPGEKIEVTRALTDNEEGMNVAKKIFDIKNGQQCTNRDFAILYRTNAQSRAIEEALRKRGIAYRIYGGLSFYQRKEIKDLLAYFRLAINPHDEEALKRIINYPARGIGKTSLEKIIVIANETGNSLWAVIENPGRFGISGAITNKLSAFVTMMKSFTSGLKNIPAFDLGKTIASSSGILNDLYNDLTPEGISRHEHIQELLNGLKEFSEKTSDEKPLRTLDEFMQDIALLTDADKEDEGDDKVSVMTVHGSKGLEFPYVFITGMEENLFPSQMSLNSRADLEEERRLFYVALTRAKNQVFLSYSESRYRWGNLIYCEPSRFIEEIEDCYIDFHEPVFNAPSSSKAGNNDHDHRKKTSTTFVPSKRLVKLKQVKNNEPAVKSDDTSKLEAGMEVKHHRFGKGKVVNVDGRFPEQKATILFQDSGQKQLLLKFARLEVL